MVRNVVILILIAVVAFLIVNVPDRMTVAEEEDDLGKVLANQKIIIEKLDAIDTKVNQLKMRIRQ